MKRQIIALTIILLFILSSTAQAFLTNRNTLENISNKIIFQEENKSIKSEKIEYLCPVMDKVYSLKNIEKKLSTVTIVDTPSQFSWTNYRGKDWTTEVKNQGQCGSCWDFTALGVIESIINIREKQPELNPDLSEQYVLSCLPKAGGCNGGSTYDTFEYIKDTSEDGNHCNGIIPEEYFSYQADSNIPCSQKEDDWQNFLIPISDYGYLNLDGTEHDRKKIKSKIYKDGPVGTYIAATDQFRKWGIQNHNKTAYYPKTLQPSWINHMVTIVGWKDDPNIENGGYWICKNSWGKFWGYNGFFNIEYDTLHIDDVGIMWADYNKNDFNWPPKANPGGPYQAKIDEKIVLNAENSFDCENNPLTYTWFIEDEKNNQTGKTVNYTFQEKGIKNITLIVTDPQGKTDKKETYCAVEFWEEKDEWSYNFEKFKIQIKNENKEISIDAKIPNFNLQLAEEKKDTYHLDISGQIKGEIDISIEELQATAITNKETSFQGKIIIDKPEMTFKKINFKIKPFLKTKTPSFFLKIPIPLHINLTMDFEKGLKFIDFPLKKEKNWDTTYTKIKIDGSIDSIWFKILNFVNKISDKKIIPKPYSDLLPSADISKAMKMLTGKTDFYLPVIEDLECTQKKTIGTKAGTFEAYKVQIMPFIDYYYSPNLKNIIKLSIEKTINDTPYGNMSTNIKGEITSYK
ncbi:MAG: C1 family peptidase [Candidatus Thermoplasmatota archaeon]